MSETTTRKWNATALGPRQVKPLERAIRDLRSMNQCVCYVRGVRGSELDRSYMVRLFAPPATAEWGERVSKAEADVFDSCSGVVTPKNVKEIVAKLDAARAELRPHIPEIDETISPEEDARNKQRAAEMRQKEREQSEACAKSWAELEAAKPARAQSLILALYVVDKSDPMTDYFAAFTERVVALSWLNTPAARVEDLQAAKAAWSEIAGLDTKVQRGSPTPGASDRLHLNTGDGPYSTGWRVLCLKWEHVRGMYERREIEQPRLFESQDVAAPITLGTPGSNAGKYNIVKVYHDKRKCDVWIAAPIEKLPDHEYQLALSRCRECGGWYSRKWGSSPGGFAFDSENRARLFADETPEPAECAPARDQAAMKPEPINLATFARKYREARESGHYEELDAITAELID